MQGRRRIAALVALFLTTSAAVSAAPQADPAADRSAAETALRFVEVGLTDVPGVGDVTGGLGILRLVAGSDGTSSLSLDDLHLLGQVVSGTDVTSAGPAASDERRFAAGDATTGLDVRLARHRAERVPGGSRALVEGLDGTLFLAGMPTTVGAGRDGSSVSAVGSTATSSATVVLDGLRIDLRTILPFLDRLPLGTLLDLAAGLDVPGADLPGLDDLLARGDAVRDLIPLLEELADVEGRRADLASRLDELVGDDPAVLAAREALDTARGRLPGLERTLVGMDADLARAEAELAAAELVRATRQAEAGAALATATAGLETALADLAVAQADLAAAEGSLSRADDVVAAATAAVADATATVASIEATLASLHPLLDAVLVTSLRSDLAAAEADVATAQAALSVAQADRSSRRAARDAAAAEVGAAQAAVGAATAARDAASTPPALADAIAAVEAASLARDLAGQALDAATSALDGLRRQVADLEAALQAALADAADLAGGPAAEVADLLADVVGQVDGLVARVSALLDLVGSLPDLHAALADGVGAVPVVRLGGLGLVVTTRATPAGFQSDITCLPAVVEVLGASRRAGNCDELTAAFDALAAPLRLLGDHLPVAMALVPDVEVLSTTTSDDSRDTEVRGTTATRLLGLRLPSVGLVDVADDLVADLLAAAAALTGVPDVASRLPLGQAGARAFAGPGLVAGAGALPTGVGLAGLRTVGVDVVVGDIVTEVVSGSDVVAGTATLPPGLVLVPREPVADPVAGGPGQPRGEQGAPGGDAPASPDAPGGGPTGGAPLPATGGGLGIVALALAGLAGRRHLPRP